MGCYTLLDDAYSCFIPSEFWIVLVTDQAKIQLVSLFSVLVYPFGRDVVIGILVLLRKLDDQESLNEIFDLLDDEKIPSSRYEVRSSGFENQALEMESLGRREWWRTTSEVLGERDRGRKGGGSITSVQMLSLEKRLE
ncbi:hypothetical protein Tco_1463279 [Tanacetum coccineum]